MVRPAAIEDKTQLVPFLLHGAGGDRGKPVGLKNDEVQMGKLKYEAQNGRVVFEQRIYVRAERAGVLVDGVPWSQNAAGKIFGRGTRLRVQQRLELDGAMPIVAYIQLLCVKRPDGGRVLKPHGVGRAQRQRQAFLLSGKPDGRRADNSGAVS